MKVRDSLIVGITQGDIASQWEEAGPFVPSSQWRRAEYATTVLHEMGAEVAYVVLSGYREIKAPLIQAIMDRGVLVNGKKMNLRFITQRKGTSAPLPLVDDETAKLTEAMFPRPIDVVRMGALLTPMRGGVARKVKAKVLLTTPDDPRFQLGDGQGCFRANWLPKHLAYRWKIQFRGVLHGLNGAGMLAKGTLLRCSDEKMAGYDLVLTKNEVKGGDLPLGEHEIEVTLGVMQGENEKMSGWTTFGRQFMQHMPEEFFENAETDRYVRRVAKQINKLKDQPTKLARFLTLRSDDGDVDRRQLLGFAAHLCEALGNNMLMFSGMIRRLLSEALADRLRNLAVSGGMTARYYMLTCDNTLQDGQVVIGDRSFRRSHLGESQVVAGRNPHTESKGAVAVKLSGDRRVEEDYAVVNGKTMVDSAADFDGDTILVGVGLAPQMEIWRAMQAKVDRSNDQKVRQKGAAPATKAEMIAIALNANIGLIERCLANFVAIEHILGGKVKGYLGERAVSVDVQEVKDFLAVEMQKSVDGIKTGSVPNMKAVKQLLRLSNELISREDVGYIPLDNGDLPIFRCAPKDPKKITPAMTDLGVEPGEFIIPSNYVSDRTPLGRHMRKVENLVPWVELDTIQNASFFGWLDLIPGDGATVARKSIADFNDALRKAHALPKELEDEAVSEAIRAFREEWRAHFRSKDGAWLRSAASMIWTSWSTGSSENGYVLWHSIPEVWATMLLERKADIGKRKPLRTGKIVGKDFGDVMGSEDEVWVDATVYMRGDKLRVRVGRADNMLSEDTSAEPGRYTACVRRTPTAGRFAAVFHERGYELPVVQREANAPEEPADAAQIAEFVTFEAESEQDETAALAAMVEDGYEEIEAEVDFE